MLSSAFLPATEFAVKYTNNTLAITFQDKFVVGV
jgi:hypothetical protein